MPEKGKGNSTLVEFDSLELEEDSNEFPNRIAKAMEILKEKLSAEDYAAIGKELGVKTDLSNEDLLAAIKKELQKKDKEYPEDKDKEEEMASYKDFMTKCMKAGKSLKECADEWKEKKPKSQEAIDMASYKDYMSKCMKGGKSLKECADAWKKKYPEPKKEEISEVEELAKELAKKKDEDEEEEEDKYPEPAKKAIRELQERIQKLEKKAEDAKIEADVQRLISEKHLAPVQRDPIVKLSKKLDPETRDELLNVIRTTQKFRTHEDAGKISSSKPGTTGLTPEQKEFILKSHGINDLIMDKGVRKNN